MTHETSDGVTVSLQQIYDLLRSIERRMITLEQAPKPVVDGTTRMQHVETVVADQEDRIRRLESTASQHMGELANSATLRANLAAAIAVISVLLAIARSV